MMLTILQGDALENLRALAGESVQCCVTSPPYWGLRDYGVTGQIGPEESPEAYVTKLVEIFREVGRVLKKDGTLWLNLGDSYAANGQNGRGEGETRHKCTMKSEPPPQRRAITPAGLKAKDLIGIPWRVAFALQADGWYLRSDIIWHKPNPMPESVTDRPTKAHEYLFLLSKSERYFYDAEAIKEHSGRRHPERANKRSVWTVPTAPYAEAHFATYPPELIEPCILAGSLPGETILDPFAGSGTTGMVAIELGRKALLIELSPDYIQLIKRRCNVTPGLGI